MTTDVMSRRPGTGRGQRATQLQSADLATQISNFASVTAALCSALGNRQAELARLAPLTVRAEKFAALIEDLQGLDPDTVRTYRELVPFKVWRQGTREVHVAPNLADDVRQLLADIKSGTATQEALLRHSEMFDDLAESFQTLGRQLLVQGTEQATSD